MAIRIGYACINTQLPSCNKTLRLSNVTPERVIELGRKNLDALAEILLWNHHHQFCLFRISSEVVPLGSHPANIAQWWEALRSELDKIAMLIDKYGIRVSMHPGQYTVLNSPRPEVVEASISELEYHARFLDAIGTDQSAKIVLHLGGVYGDKAAAMDRFSDQFTHLSDAVRRRLVLENDEKNYTIVDALELAHRIYVPVVFDFFHHVWNPALTELSTRMIIERATATWQPDDGPPKLHYSDQWPGKPHGSHSQTVDLAAFMGFYQQIRDLEVDVMLEVKDKEQSVLALYDRYPELLSDCL